MYPKTHALEYSGDFPRPAIMLVGYNMGPVTEREVSTLEGEALARNYGWKFIELSS